MTWTSTTPAAIAGLLAALKGSPDLSGVEVLDGPTVSNTGALEAVTVGYTDETSPTAVDGTLLVEGLAAAPSREQYTIQCAVSVLNGSTDITAARSRAYELLAAVGAVLADDPRLGGAVMRTMLSTAQLSQQQVAQGALARVVFGVEVEAYSLR